MEDKEPLFMYTLTVMYLKEVLAILRWGCEVIISFLADKSEITAVEELESHEIVHVNLLGAGSRIYTPISQIPILAWAAKSTGIIRFLKVRK